VGVSSNNSIMADASRIRGAAAISQPSPPCFPWTEALYSCVAAPTGRSPTRVSPSAKG